MHYRRWRVHGDPLVGARGVTGGRCSSGDCDGVVMARGLCSKCYQRAYRETLPRCSFDECGRPSGKSGLCLSHSRMRDRGEDLRPVLDRDSTGVGMSPAERLEHFSSRDQGSGCRVWSGLEDDGYPIFGKSVMGTRLAHRIAYMLSSGETLPPHVSVHHKCGNRRCVEPAHLQAVRPHENTAEMLERKYYKARIAALESALRDLDPNHPLLEDVPID